MRVEFSFGGRDREGAEVITTGLPLLAGEAREWVADVAGPASPAAGLQLWSAPGRLVGAARSEPGEGIEAAAQRIYDAILRAAAGLNLYRVWNLVPAINADSPTGLENYRAFCRGRSHAFEATFGGGFVRRLPAASALGTTAPELTVAFLAGADPAEHFENPAQVPAYEYPAEHGPRPPSFARATVVRSAGGRDAFISGTSAVVGHATVAPRNTLPQLDCTFENLRLISRASGLGDDLGAGAGAGRHFKVYIRDPGDLAAVRRAMEAQLLRPGDRVSYLEADICREALNVEIEVAVRGMARS
jgi:hypothetical protein